jgi:hypothetical protein
MFCKLQDQYRMKKCIFATDFLHFVIDFLIRIQIATHPGGALPQTQATCGFQGSHMFSRRLSAHAH